MRNNNSHHDFSGSTGRIGIAFGAYVGSYQLVGARYETSVLVFSLGGKHHTGL